MLLLIVTLNLMVTLAAAGRVKPPSEPLTVTVSPACVAASRADFRVSVVTVFSAVGRGAGSDTDFSSSTTWVTNSARVAGERVPLSESAKSGITDSPAAAWFCSISASAIIRAPGSGLFGVMQVPGTIVPDWPITAVGLAGVLLFAFQTKEALVPDCR